MSEHPSLFAFDADLAERRASWRSPRDLISSRVQLDDADRVAPAETGAAEEVQCHADT